MGRPIVISVLAEANGVGKGTAQAEGYLTRLGNKAKAVGKIVGVGVVAASVAIAGSSIRLASEAQQSIGATEQIYGKYADSVISKSDQAAQAVGLSANSYRELSNGLGAMLKNAGTPMDALAGKTDKLVSLGADMAATFGGTTADAVGAISSLMRGEADPIERYGVSIKQSDVNARLAAQGLGHLTGAKLKEAQSTARLALLYEQTKSAQGQFGRESGTLAGVQQRLGAQWEDMRAKLGMKLLPVLTKVLGYLNANGPAAFSAVEQGIKAVTPAVRTVTGVLGDLGGVVVDVAGFLVDNRAVLGVLAAGYVAYKGIVLATKAAEWALYLWQSRKVILGASQIAITKGMTIAQTAFNTALRANPIGLVVTALTALAAGAVWAYQNVDWFRAGVQTAFGWVQKAGSALMTALGVAWDVITTGVKVAGKLVKAYLMAPVYAFQGLVAAGRAMASGVTAAIGAVGKAVGSVKGKVTGALKGAGDWLKSAGENIMRGLVKGIDRGLAWVRDKVSGVGKLIPGWLKKVLGINSPARATIPAGYYSALGVAEGFISGRSAIRRSLDATANTITGYTMPSPAMATDWTIAGGSITRAGGSGEWHVHFDIKVEAAIGADGVQIGRDIVKYLRDYVDNGGQLPVPAGR